MIKLVILALFAVVGFAGVSSARLAPGQWSSPVSIVAGGMIVFLAYEGFELIANATEDVADPGRTLPRAYYISVVFVIALYVLGAVVSVGSVPVAELVHACDYALAVAARPALGSTGFKMIAVAAMLSTASAINATLYGTERLSDMIARKGELSEILERRIWNRPLAGLEESSIGREGRAQCYNEAHVDRRNSSTEAERVRRGCRCRGRRDRDDHRSRSTGGPTHRHSGLAPSVLDRQRSRPCASSRHHGDTGARFGPRGDWRVVGDARRRALLRWPSTSTHLRS